MSLDVDDFEGREYWIDRLGIIPSSCIERVDRVHGHMTLFHGCFDWHSSVHGHWALFRMDLAGSGKHHELAVQAVRRFTDENISSVIRELQEAPGFEMPYGRAWLLRLCIEYDLWSSKHQLQTPINWRELGDYTADSLMGYYVGESTDRLPNILTNQYRNDSFALVQLCDYFKHCENSERLEEISEYISRHFLVDDLIFDPEHELDPKAFLSPFWSWVYLLAKTQPDEVLKDLIIAETLSEDYLQPIPGQEISRGRVHHLGMNWSRAWAMKSLARRMHSWNKYQDFRGQLVKSYHAHIQQSLSVHKEFSQDNPDVEENEAYYAYYHWVPQFGIYAITD